ncbi:SusC/RagA family TonB-linked outer membrane protein [Hymenobacter edaphi]|uniref:SusC/RagA family TonB-linked outer membrane protein n=1 Tax=Hymenobacter edaphi TaxID=2211146 RepID=A0A328BTH2_9BACT|nr:TonB-dependent receptor [Hymenobacter edaphi]RAK69316.1 SusC/RagA family TonB-linked outer membrane protein [Hymenobacter edaphi]
MNESSTPLGRLLTRPTTLTAGILLQALPLAASAQLLAVNHAGGQHPAVAPAVAESVALKSLLRQWETEYRVTIFYESNVVGNKRVLPQATGSLEDKLSAVLPQAELRFKKLRDDYFVVVSEPAAGAASATPSGAATADVAVSGRVTGAGGEALPGVTVLVKGTAIGTATNADGQFALNVPEGSTLVFTAVGYVRQEVPVSGAASGLSITLQEDLQALSEVVVVGYGTQSRQALTTSVASVSSEALERQPVAGFDQALQGQAAGVQVTAPSGAPGAGINVRIRGNATVSLNASPLYVIDGVPVLPTYDQELGVSGQRPNPLNALNPNDIESIDVLKDGAAAAIYGLRASNGVVVITTKRGKVGKAQVGFSMYYGRQTLRKKLDVLNGQQFAALYNEMRANDGQDPAYRPDTVRTTDWQDEVYRTASIQNYQLNVSGGTDKTRYYLAGGYFKQDGISLNSGFNRYNFKLNLDQQLGTRFRAGTSLNLSRTLNNNSTRSENGAGSSGTVLGTLAYIPTVPVRAADGSYALNPFARNFDNPVGNLLESRNLATIYQVIGNVYGELDILKNLTLRSTAGIDFRSQIENEFWTRDFPGNPADPAARGRARTSTNQQVIWLQENTLTYRPDLGEKHDLTLLLGESMQASDRFTSSASANGFATSSVPYLLAGSKFSAPSSYEDQWGLVSYFGRAIYNFDRRYLLTLSLRADGSSRFRDGEKFGYFPAVGLGWRVSEESFFPKGKTVSELKLRGSFGANGNQEFYTYARFPRYSSSNLTYPGVGTNVAAGVTQTDIGNLDLKWETTKQYNLGLDVGMFDDRLTLTLDAYRKDTRDLLTDVDIPLSTGSSNTKILQNVGRIRNHGVELGLTTTNVRAADNGFGWTTNLNLTMNRNEVLDLGQVINTDGRAVDRRLPSGNGFTLVGQPLGVFYGYQVQGIFQSQAEVDEAPFQASATAAGDIRFRDLNGDGKITDLDRTIIGNPNPKAIGGVTNTFTYKGLELSVFFQGSFGNDVYNQNRETLESMANPINQTTRVLNRWTPTNRDTDVPRAVLADPNGNARYSDRFIEDGSYVRLKNLTLAYNVPAGLTRRAYISGLRVYATTQNLVTWTKYSGYDPEVSSDPFSTTGFGRDFGVYPQARTYTVGLNATF